MIESFKEWVKTRSKKISVKNPAIDAFIKAADNLKRDLDELDSLEKKSKNKPTKDKTVDGFKDYKSKRDDEEKEEDIDKKDDIKEKDIPNDIRSDDVDDRLSDQKISNFKKKPISIISKQPR